MTSESRVFKISIDKKSPPTPMSLEEIAAGARDGKIVFLDKKTKKFVTQVGWDEKSACFVQNGADKTCTLAVTALDPTASDPISFRS